MLQMFYFCIGVDVCTFIIESLYVYNEIEKFIVLTTSEIKINKTSNSRD